MISRTVQYLMEVLDVLDLYSTGTVPYRYKNYICSKPLWLGHKLMTLCTMRTCAYNVRVTAKMETETISKYFITFDLLSS